MKKIILTLLFFLLVSCQKGQEYIIIGSWNIRYLSNNSRDDTELIKIAKIMSEMDIVAVQEIRDEEIIKRLANFLPNWDSVNSPPIGESNKEIYAYFWNTHKIKSTGMNYLLPDEEDLLLREPFISDFSSEDFIFRLCTIHVKFGESIKDRNKEVIALHDMVKDISYNYVGEKNIILLGDFNLSPESSMWPFNQPWYPLFFPPEKTTIGNKSLYDNIILYQDCLDEYSGETNIIKFDQLLYNGDLEKASLEISDHRPIWAKFITN